MRTKDQPEPYAIEEKVYELQWPRQFTISLLFSVTTAIAIGFVAPLGLISLLVEAAKGAFIFWGPLVVFLWIYWTPPRRWKQSAVVAWRIFGMPSIAWVTLYVILLARMNFMGQGS